MRGITSDSGLDALDVFGMRVRFLASRRLSNEMRSLLSGESVLSRDGDLELSVYPVGDHWVLTAILVGARYKCEIGMTPRAEDDGLGPIEPLAGPVPDQWFKVLTSTEVRWQLLNVRINSVAPVEV